MARRISLVFLLFVLSLAAEQAYPQPGDRYLSTEARILDMAFPTDVDPKPYMRKLIMRFGDTATQLVIVIYPGAKCELISYSLPGLGNKTLPEWLAEALAKDPSMKDKDLLARLQVSVIRSAINYEQLTPFLKALKAIRVSPVLADRIAVDEISEYEFWYDTWQESVHYTITGPFKGTSQDQLVQWMLNFRANVSRLIQPPSSAGGPSK